MNQRVIDGNLLEMLGIGLTNAAWAKDTTPPEGMVLIPGGTFSMGSDSGDSNQELAHQVTLQSFYLDTYLVTAQQYADYLAKLKRDTEKYQAALPKANLETCNYDLKKKQVKVGKGNHPINCITWVQAKAYCETQGKRLPTAAEWEYAACGTTGSKYPWGDATPRGKKDGYACWSGVQKRTGTCPVGSYPKTLLGKLDQDGIADLAGNLWEWTDSAYEENYTKLPEACGEGKSCVVRGGSWDVNRPEGLRASLRNHYGPQDVINIVGFRCAKDK